MTSFYIKILLSQNEVHPRVSFTPNKAEEPKPYNPMKSNRITLMFFTMVPKNVLVHEKLMF